MIRVSLSDQVLDNRVASDAFVRRGKPKWLKAQLPRGEQYSDLLRLVKDQKLHTVCEEASCPNLGECWSAGVATLMILGDTCTRSCGFCHIKTGRPPVLDSDEPKRVAEAVKTMDLNYVVITSVNRDELPDGGAAIWAETIQRTRDASPTTQIEVLIPDFCGDWEALQRVLDARPDVLNHNLETVQRMYPAVRPQHPPRLLEDLAGIVRVGEDIVQNDGIEALGVEIQCMHVALAQAAVIGARQKQIDSRKVAGPGIDVDADRTICPARE